MKLLFVVNNFNFGGPQKSLLNLFYELKDTNHEIDLMILNQEDSLTEYLPDYVNVKPVNTRFSVLMLNRKHLISKMINNYSTPKLVLNAFLFILKSKLKLHDTTKAKQQFWVDNKWVDSTLKKHYDYAIGVSGGHSVYFIEDFINAKHKIGWIRTDYRVLKRDHNIDQKYFDKMDGMLSVSKMCSDIFEDIFNIKPFTFYNSLPIKLYENIADEDINISTGTFNLCTICRLDNGKGLDLLIEAAKILKSKNIEVKWYVVGAGKLSNWLDEEIKKNHLEQIVLPVGFRFNTGSIVRKMDILVHPSRFEGKSNTIDEALHYNVPVVATNFETVYEQIIDGENGFIVSMDGNEISLKIEELKNNKELYQIIKSNLESAPNENIDKGKEFIETIKHIGG
ncbi:glycosyltransferase [Staphylococcus haemolyticus]|uniref:glycosyltransferase n=1 Tax=Staphylococcus haemolyticus TaxID=1283 RepID=UPI0018798677|nr:glycosyltransferase [Staphylococcus haemolyticus]MBE7342528.1 glycosyltransferase [Staphylococcus haemolyticus]